MGGKYAHLFAALDTARRIDESAVSLDDDLLADCSDAAVMREAVRRGLVAPVTETAAELTRTIREAVDPTPAPAPAPERAPHELSSTELRARAFGLDTTPPAPAAPRQPEAAPELPDTPLHQLDEETARRTMRAQLAHLPVAQSREEDNPRPGAFFGGPARSFFGRRP